MAKNETTAKLNVDISDLKKGIQEANRQIRLANAEFKAASTSMADWEKTTNGVSQKISQLDKVLASQNKILDSYKQQLEVIVKEQGENSKGADEMRIKIANQQAAVNKTQNELNKYKATLADLEKTQNASAKAAKSQAEAYNNLKQNVEGQKSELADLKAQYAGVVLEQGKGSKAAKDLAKQISEMSRNVSESEKALEEAEKAADTFDNTIEETGDDAEKASDGFTVMKGVLADLASTAIKAMIDGLKKMASAAADAWREFDKGRDTIIKLTGATGDAATALTESFGNVAQTVVADSEEIGSAIGEVNTRFGVNGKELEDLSTLYIKFSKITGEDLVSSIDDTQKAMSAYGIEAKDAGKFLDALAKTSQATGVSTGSLTNGIISNATAFQEMGLSVDQAVLFMGQLEKSGANSETVLNGMRKALKNSAKEGLSLDEALISLQNEIENGSDGMDGLNAAYELFGKSGDQIYGAIKNGTVSFKDLTSAVESSAGAVNDTYEETLDATDKIALEVQKLKYSVAGFIDDFIKEHGDKIEEIVNAVKEKIPVILQWFRDTYNKIKPIIQGIVDVIKPIIKDVKKALEPIVDALKNLIKSLLPKIEDALGWMKDNIELVEAAIAGVVGAMAGLWVTKKIMAVVNAFKAWKIATEGQTIAEALLAKGQAVLNAVMSANPIGLIIAGITALVAAFVVLWNKSEAFREFWSDLWEGIKLMASDAWDAITGFFTGAYDKVSEIWNGITEFFSTVWESIKAVFSLIPQWIDENIFQPIAKFFQILVKIFKTGWESIKKFAQTCWNGIKAVWTTVKNWFNTNVIVPVKTFFSNMWNGIKDLASRTWEGIKSIWNAVSGWFNTTIIQPVAKFFTGMWNGLKTGASKAWEGIKGVFSHVTDWFKNVFSKAWEAVKNVFSTGGRIFDGIKEGIVDAFKAVVNAIIRGINKVIAIPFDAINSVLEKIRNFSIMGARPFGGIGSITVPQIPELARGGILGKGQMGLLEGNGAEAVVPLDQNKRWIKAVTKSLKTQLQTNGMVNGATGTITGGGGQIVNYNFNQTNNSPKALSRLEIYRQTKNQIGQLKALGRA